MMGLHKKYNAMVYMPGWSGTVRRTVVLEEDYDQLRAELDALKAGRGEAVYVVPVTGSLDEIDAPVWPFINEEARMVGAEHGRIETYKYERANGGVAVLWDANRIHAMAVTIRDDMNRTRCIRMLTAPPVAPVAPVAPEPILVEAVAVTRENEDGELYLDWLLEGGISALEFAGTTLLVAHGQITDDSGSGEVYTAPPATGDCEFHGADKSACDQYSGCSPCAPPATCVIVSRELLEDAHTLVDLLRSEKTIRGDGNPPGMTIEKCVSLLGRIDRALLASGGEK